MPASTRNSTPSSRRGRSQSPSSGRSRSRTPPRGTYRRTSLADLTLRDCLRIYYGLVRVRGVTREDLLYAIRRKQREEGERLALMGAVDGLDDPESPFVIEQRCLEYFGRSIQEMSRSPRTRWEDCFWLSIEPDLLPTIREIRRDYIRRHGFDIVTLDFYN